MQKNKELCVVRNSGCKLLTAISGDFNAFHIDLNSEIYRKSYTARTEYQFNHSNTETKT